jgi:hypothetical protein
VFEINNDATTVIKDDFMGKRIDFPEYARRLRDAVPRNKPVFTREFRLDQSDVQVNVPLTAEDFKIEYGAGAYVFEANNPSVVWKVPTWREWSLRKAPWVIGAFVLCGLLAAGTWYVRERFGGWAK